MLVANTDNSSENEVSGEKTWSQNGFFKEINSNSGMEKVNFPQNTLIYKNQAYLTVQKGENIFYADYFILGQIIFTANVPADVDSYECLPHEVIIVRPLYDAETGDFKGIKNTIGLINIRGDQEEVFFNYRYCDNKSKVIYCNQRRWISNVFTVIVFNKYKDEMFSENRETFSKKLFFLPATTDRKEKINQHKANASLFPNDIPYDDFREMSPYDSHFNPWDLEIPGEKRKIAREIVVEAIKKKSQNSKF